MRIVNDLLQESKRIRTISDFENLGINYIVRVVNGKKFLPDWVFDEKNYSNIIVALSVFLEEALVKDANFATDQAIGFMLRISKKPKDLEKVVTDFTDAIIAYGQSCESGWFKSPEIQQTVDAVYNAKIFPNRELHNLEKVLQDTRAKKSKSKNVKAAEANALYDTLYNDGTWKLCVPKNFEGDSELASHMIMWNGHTKARWCTASSKGYYDHYTYDGKKPLYVFQYYKNGNYKEAWQLAFMSRTKHIEFKDKNDHEHYSFVLKNAPKELLTKVVDIDSNISLVDIVDNYNDSIGIDSIYKKLMAAELGKILETEFLDPNDPETLKITSNELFEKIKRMAYADYEAVVRELPVTKVVVSTNLADGMTIEENENIKTVVIEGGVTRIPPRSFFRCSNLETVQIADSVEEIGEFSFAGCPANIHMPANLKVLETTVFKFSRTEAVLDLSNLTVEELGDEAFRNFEILKKIILPKTLIKIGQNAFWNCYSLREVVLPETLQTIENNAFDNCNSLETLKVPTTLKKLGKEVFYSSGLKSIDLSACSKLKLRNGAFAGCSELISAKLPKQLSKLPVATFDCCGMLQDVELPETLEIIETEAFASCKSLQTIKFPKSLKFVENYAFINCKGLKKVTMSSDKPKIAPRAFLGTDIKIL